MSDKVENECFFCCYFKCPNASEEFRGQADSEQALSRWGQQQLQEGFGIASGMELAAVVALHC